MTNEQKFWIDAHYSGPREIGFDDLKALCRIMLLLERTGEYWPTMTITTKKPESE